ncbi:DUF4333 domain-containing protein [Nocardioides litoris]|uniref:DUF4333 domain-containing protein n=1 Tax=Nocardioides litoris TaxID=1926648 RepID=UPI00111F367F|nr:DUF4333 domain-containing protein [Nocardioides litoris]
MSHRRPTARRLLAAAPLAALALGLSACSSGAVPQSDVEDRISSELEEQVGQAPDDVSCPDDLEAEEGATLECTLTAGEDELGVTVTVDSVDGDTVNYGIVVDDQPQ